MQNNTTRFTFSPIGTTLSRWWADSSIRIPIVIFVAARFLTLVIAVSGGQFGTIKNPYADDPIFLASLEHTRASGPIHDLIEPWHRWDTGWYMKIAGEGYDQGDGSIIFAPLYPALMRVFGTVLGDMLLAGLLISSVTCLVYLILLYKLVVHETGSDEVAQTTLVLLISFPTAFYLLAGYTESLFLVCTVGAMLAAMRQRWYLAALLAGCSTLTRLQGWVLFFPIGWLALTTPPPLWQIARQSWPDRVRLAFPRLLAAGSGPAITAGFMLYLRLADLGDLAHAYEDPWGMWVRAPWAAVVDVVKLIGDGEASLTEYAGLVALVIIVVLSLLSLRRLPVVYHLYIWPTLVLILLRYYPMYLLNGTMRYALDFFPIFITAGILLANRPRWRLVWVSLGLFLQLWMLFLFAQWGWIA